MILGSYQQHTTESRFASLFITLFLLISSAAQAQFATKWMAVGSLQSWYSNMGCEIEEGRVKVQQDGLQWPAIYPYQDMEAAKGLWIGVKNYTDAEGRFYPAKVVHVGPRVSGVGEFFPLEFKTISRFDPPKVFVDGNLSYSKPNDNDAVDPALKADRMIYNVVNTSIGLTMTRKILAFSQQYNDNYIIYDYTFTNTGNIDADPQIELPNQTLDSLYIFFQYRYAVCAQTRYVFGNATGWGINTMNDARGDGLNPSTTFFPGNKDNDIRAQYSWHGKYPPFTKYDNIGGPIWEPDPYGYVDKFDTTGRLGAAQFVGVVTIHADRSATDTTDDPNQPSTTMYVGSDDPLNSQNDQYNIPKMQNEYAWMASGHMSPRHADKVGPGGDPALGTTGGYSIANGYGPYRLGPGQSIHIVMAEAAAGLDREACIEIGRAYKASGGNNTAPITYKGVQKTKNEWVYTGRDSLFQTFRRAIANYNSGYNIPQPPLPPSSFNVTSGGDRITLTWDIPNDPTLRGFRIYRAVARYDSTYHLIYEAQPTQNSYRDTSVVRGVAHYYYIVSVGDGGLVSGRYYTQSYDPAYLLRPPGSSLDAIRVVPNPYNIAADPNRLLYPNEPNKIGFLNIPGECTIKIYTELGELIKTIEHTNGSGDEYWDLTTSYNQIIVSGVYIVVIETPNGERAIRKFVVIR